MSRVTCPLCESSESSVVQRGVRHDPDAEVHKCGRCELVSLWPRPSERSSSPLAAAGFAAEIAGIQRYDLSNHLVWALEHHPGGLGRYPMLGAAASDAYAAALIEHGVSDTLWAVARRAELT